MRRSEYEVHAHGSLGVRGDRERLRRGLRRLRRLDALARLARTNPLAYPLVHVEPVKAARVSKMRLLTVKVTAMRGIVVLVQDAHRKLSSRCKRIEGCQSGRSGM